VLRVFTATVRAAHIVEASTDAELDTALPEAVKSLYDRAIAAGHGNDNWTSLYEVITSVRRSAPV
jgi:3-hydroxyisobutyrate dehydrogenase-like beta-hydroxyacid dehydrogenase